MRKYYGYYFKVFTIFITRTAVLKLNVEKDYKHAANVANSYSNNQGYRGFEIFFANYLWELFVICEKYLINNPLTLNIHV